MASKCNFESKGDFFELEIGRHGGTYDWNSDGTAFFSEGTDKSLKIRMNY